MQARALREREKIYLTDRRNFGDSNVDFGGNCLHFVTSSNNTARMQVWLCDLELRQGNCARELHKFYMYNTQHFLGSQNKEYEE